MHEHIPVKLYIYILRLIILLNMQICAQKFLRNLILNSSCLRISLTKYSEAYAKISKYICPKKEKKKNPGQNHFNNNLLKSS